MTFPLPTGAGGRPGACVALGIALALALPARAADVAAVKSKDIPPYNAALAGFKQGYTGAVDEYDLGGDLDNGKPIARKLEATRPRVVLAIGAKAAKALLDAGVELPIVFCMVLDPRDDGIVAPNVTGISLEVPVKDQLAEFKKAVPRITRIAVLYNPDKTKRAVDDARAAVGALGVELVAEAVSDKGDVPDALARVMGKADALWLVPDPSLLTRETVKLMLEQTLARKMPLMAYEEAFVKMGALLSLSPDFTAIGGGAADIVKLILAGKKPSEIPVQSAKRTLVVNPSIAKTIGVTFPDAVLQAAKKVD